MMIPVLLTTSIFISIFIIIIWLVYLRFGNPSIIDGCWSIGILISASLYILIQEGITTWNAKVFFVWFLLFIWAARLAGYIWGTRILKNIHDPRYETLSREWKISKKIGFLLNYLLQGFLMMVLALPFLILPHSIYKIIDITGITMVLIGILGESIADFQLSKFKKNNQGEICNIGLWRYSRHPNYFFELVIWFGFALLTSNLSLSTSISFFSPIVLLIIFIFITGPITEKQMLKSKGKKFLEYRKNTSFIIPWSPQKNSNIK